MRLVDPSASPDPDTIRRTAREILAGPDYRLKPLDDDDFALLRWLWNAIQWILAPFSGIFDRLYAVSPVLAVAYVVVMIVVLVVLLWHLFHTFRTAIRGRVQTRRYGAEEGRGLQPAELEARAQSAAARQDYITAVRYLFQACLLRLEQANRRALRKGATNREYLRRFEGTPVHEPLHRFVDIIDCKWYGQGRCERSDFDECQQAHAEVLQRQGA